MFNVQCVFGMHVLYGWFSYITSHVTAAAAKHAAENVFFLSLSFLSQILYRSMVQTKKASSGARKKAKAKPATSVSEESANQLAVSQLTQRFDSLCASYDQFIM